MTRYGGLVGMIYMIVTTEQIVSRNVNQLNPQDRGQLNSWTYSQTLALIMLGQQIMDTYTYFKEEIKYKRNQLAVEHGDPVRA